ncbi:hypothetical protein Scep_007247 [Stephania cephalantha]|uniref:Uncharacterized protein n=1 Tax=Stephania cephalantha TaxID=152367 RepID=A0AAP0KAS0_9MAGN
MPLAASPPTSRLSQLRLQPHASRGSGSGSDLTPHAAPPPASRGPARPREIHLTPLALTLTLSRTASPRSLTDHSWLLSRRPSFTGVIDKLLAPCKHQAHKVEDLSLLAPWFYMYHMSKLLCNMVERVATDGGNKMYNANTNAEEMQSSFHLIKKMKWGIEDNFGSGTINIGMECDDCIGLNDEFNMDIYSCEYVGVADENQEKKIDNDDIPEVQVGDKESGNVRLFTMAS